MLEIHLFGPFELARRQAIDNLHARMSELRRVLQPALSQGGIFHYIVRQGRPAAYAFSVKQACWLDTLEFAERIREAEALKQQAHLRQAAR